MEEAEHSKPDSNRNDAEDDIETPFDKFMKSIPKQEINIDLSKFDGIPMSKEELVGLDKIQEILKQADKEINRITAHVSARKARHSEPKVITLNRNDEKQYIRNLIYAKLHGLKIEQHDQQKYQQRKPKHCRNNCKYSDRSRLSEHNIDSGKKTSHFVEELSRELDEIIKKKVHTELTNSNYKSNIWVKNNHLAEVVSEDKTYKSDSNVLERKNLVVQNVPKINIRPCLTEQKIPNLNIYPSEEQKIDTYKVDNVILLESKHEEQPKVQFCNTGDSQNFKDSSDKNKNEEPKILPSPKPDSYNFKPKKNPSTLLKQTESVDFLCDFKHYGNDDPNSATTVLLQKKYSFLKKHSEYNKSSVPLKQNRTIVNKSKTNVSQSLPKTSSNISFNKSTKIKNSTIDYIPYSKMTIGGIRANEILNEINFETQNLKTTNVKIETPENVSTKQEETPKELITSLSSLSVEEHKEETKTTDYTEDFEKSLSESTNSQESPELSIKTVNSNIDEVSRNSNTKSPELNIISSPELVELENKIPPENKLSMPTLSLHIKPKPLLKMKSKVDTFDYIHHIDTEDHAIQTTNNATFQIKHTQTSPNLERHENSQESMPNLTLDDVIQMKKEIQNILSFKENLRKEISNVERHPENKFIQTSPLKIQSIDKQSSPLFVKRFINMETMTDTFDIEDGHIIQNSNSPQPIEYSKVQEPINTKVNDLKNVSFDDSARNISSGVLTDVSHSETSETKSIGEINFKLLRKRNITLKTRSKNKINKVHFNSTTNSELHSSTSISKSEGEINFTDTV